MNAKFIMRPTLVVNHQKDTKQRSFNVRLTFRTTGIFL